MPGIAGSISLVPDLPQQPGVVSRLTQSLMHEHCYSVQQIPCPQDGVAVIVNPGIDPLICGVSQDAGMGVSLGFYGEFHDPPCHAAQNGDEIAAILLRKYLQHEDRFPLSLDGSYVIFVADARRKKYLLFNDYYASRPVFYGIEDGRFYFSPEAKGVARMPGFNAAVDHDAMVTFLVCSSLVGEHTFYKNVKPLLPGTILTISYGRLTRSKSSQYAPCTPAIDRGEAYYRDLTPIPRLIAASFPSCAAFAGNSARSMCCAARSVSAMPTNPNAIQKLSVNGALPRSAITFA